MASFSETFFAFAVTDLKSLPAFSSETSPFSAVSVAAPPVAFTTPVSATLPSEAVAFSVELSAVTVPAPVTDLPVSSIDLPETSVETVSASPAVTLTAPPAVAVASSTAPFAASTVMLPEFSTPSAAVAETVPASLIPWSTESVFVPSAVRMTLPAVAWIVVPSTA